MLRARKALLFGGGDDLSVLQQAGASSIFLFWLPLLTAPRAVRLAWYVNTNQGRALNKALKDIADKLHGSGTVYVKTQQQTADALGRIQRALGQGRTA